MAMDAGARIGEPGGAVSAGRAQTLRERAIACLVTGLCLMAVGGGVYASDGGNPYLAGTFGLAGIGLLAAFGIVWDMQYPPRPERAKETRRGVALLVLGLLILANACLTVALHAK